MAIEWKKIVGVLVVILLTSGIVYVAFGQEVKIRVDYDKTTIYVFENSRWIVGGREYNALFDGTSKMNRRPSEISIETIIGDNNVTIRRTTPYIRGPVIVDTYYFEGNITEKKLFPIHHTVEIHNGSGYFYRYEVRDLDYGGETDKNLNVNYMRFGKDISVEWDDNYRWAHVYKTGILKVQYDIPSDYEVYNVKLFDPPGEPAITVTSPTNTSYTVASIDLNWSSNETGTVTYELNGIGNESLTKINYSQKLTDGTSYMVSLFADSNYVYGGGYDTNLYVWNRTNMSLHTTLTDAAGIIMGIFADSNYIYGASSDNNVYVWNISNMSLHTTLTDGGADDMVSVYADDDYIYGANDDYSVYVWNRTNMTLHANLSDGTNLMFDVFADNDYIYGANKNTNLYVWNRTNMSLHTTLTGTFYMESVYADSDYIYGANRQDPELLIWNRTNMSLHTTMGDPTSTFFSVHADSDYIYGASNDNNIYVWNRTNMSLHTTLTEPGTTMYEVYADSKYIYGACGDSDIYVWDRYNPFNTTITAQEGSNTLYVWMNNIEGYINYTRVVFTVNTPPVVSLYNVTGITDDDTPGIDFNFTDTENLKAECYLLFNGTAYDLNASTDNATRTTLTANESMADDDYAVIVQCSDGMNAGNSSPIILTIDTTAPSNIGFLAPTPPNGTIVIQDNYLVNVSFTDANPDWCELELTNSSGTNNYTMTQGDNQTEYYFNVAGQSDYNTYFYAYCNDTGGRLGMSVARHVEIDTVPPTLAVENPENNTVTTYEWVWVNVTTDGTSQWCGYSLGEAGNITLSNDSATHYYANLTDLARGTYNITFNCNDTGGNVNTSLMYFFGANLTLNISDSLITTPFELNLSTGSFSFNYTDNTVYWYNATPKGQDGNGTFNVTSDYPGYAANINVSLNESPTTCMTFYLSNSSSWFDKLTLSTANQTIYVGLTAQASQMFHIWIDMVNCTVNYTYPGEIVFDGWIP